MDSSILDGTNRANRSHELVFHGALVVDLLSEGRHSKISLVEELVTCRSRVRDAGSGDLKTSLVHVLSGNRNRVGVYELVGNLTIREFFCDLGRRGLVEVSVENSPIRLRRRKHNPAES